MPLSDESLKQVIDSAHFREATEHERAAREAWEAASARLTVAQIQRRAAELASQSLESIGRGELRHTIGGDLSPAARKAALAFVRYAVFGRCDSI